MRPLYSLAATMKPLRSATPWLLAAAGYTTLTVVFMWPLPTQLSSVLPHDLGDPVLNTWILWWNAHAVPLTARWWNAPFFWPLPDATALSESLLGLSLLGTPLQWAGADPIATYNTLFLLSFSLSALAMHALAFTLVRRHDAAALSGLLFGFSPYRTAQIAHLQMLWAFLMPVALLALHRYARDGRRRWLVLFGGAWIGVALSNAYFLFFFPVLIACWIAWFLLLRGDISRGAAAIAAWTIASIPLIPLVAGYERVHQRLSLERPFDEIRHFSADMTAFVRTGPSVWMWTPLSHVYRAEQQLFPGITAPLLIAFALGISLWRTRGLPARHRRLRATLTTLAVAFALLALTPTFIGPWRVHVGGVTLVSVSAGAKPFSLAIWCLVARLMIGPRARRAMASQSALTFYVGTAVLMYVCSLGPEPTFRGTAFWYKPPYVWLMQLPGYSSIRVPARFAMLGTLCLAAAAALALTRLTSRLGRRSALVAGIGLCAVAMADGWIAGVPLPSIPKRITALEVARNTNAVVELPLGDVEPDLAAMYRSMYHRSPVVNGYSGYVPAPYGVLRLALDEGDTGALNALDGSLTVVVDPTADDRQWKALAPSLATAAVDAESGRRILTLPKPPVDTFIPSGERLPIRSAAASAPIDLAAVTDGDPVSHWDAGTIMRGDEWITLDLGSVRHVSALMLAVGPAFGGYARALAIDVSTDGQRWTTVFEDQGAVRAIRATQLDPRLSPLTYTFVPTQAQWIRARQTGHADPFHWSICEVAVFGR